MLDKIKKLKIKHHNKRQIKMKGKIGRIFRIWGTRIPMQNRCDKGSSQSMREMNTVSMILCQEIIQEILRLKILVFSIFLKLKGKIS